MNPNKNSDIETDPIYMKASVTIASTNEYVERIEMRIHNLMKQYQTLNQAIEELHILSPNGKSNGATDKESSGGSSSTLSTRKARFWKKKLTQLLRKDQKKHEK